jgi:hypothetical protein
VSLKTYEYDAAGRLGRVIARTADGSDRTAEIYEYDPDGRQKKTIYIDVTNQRPDTRYAWGVEGTDSFYSAPGAATLKTLYNEREQPTHLLFYDAAEGLLSRVEFSYDANANLVQETKTNIVTTLPREMLAAMEPAQLQALHALLGGVGEPVCRMHRYDESGRRVETRLRMGLLGGDIQTMVYNDRGDRIAEISQHETREYGIDDKGQLADVPLKESITRSEVRIRYDYDAKGNWTRKMVETGADDDQQFTECSIERRTIEYFG